MSEPLADNEHQNSTPSANHADLGVELEADSCQQDPSAKLNSESPSESRFIQREIKSFSDVVEMTLKIPRVIALVWEAHPHLALVFVVDQIISGLAPLASVWVLKTLVDTVPLFVKIHGVSNGVAFGAVPGNLILALLVLALSWLAQEVSRPITHYCQEQINDELTKRINFKIMDKVNSLIDISILENPKFYDKLQYLQNDLAYRPIQLLSVMSQFIRVIIIVLTLGTLLAALSPWLVLVLVVFIAPKVVWSLKHLYEFWEVLNGDVPDLRKMRYYMSVVTNNLDGKEVRLLGLGEYFKKLYDETFSEFQHRRSSMRKRHLRRDFFLGICAAFGSMIGYGYTVFCALAGQISVGSMAMYLGTIVQMEQQLMELAFVVAELYRHTLYVSELFDFLDLEPVIPVPVAENCVPVPEKITSGIEFKDVYFKYPGCERYVLEGVSFTIAPSQTVAIVGENGAGKTTIVKLLSRLYDPTAGAILVDGIDIRKLNPAEWRSRMAVVFQDYCKYQMTLQQNIGVGQVEKSNDLLAIEHSAERGGAASIAKKFEQGYSTMLGKAFEKESVGVELSGGEWQRVALSRAFMRTAGPDRAHLLILDEPSASLDVQSETQTYLRFHELIADTMGILITHRFSTIKIADKIIVLENGKVIEEGTHNELTASDTHYARLFDMQAKHYR